MKKIALKILILIIQSIQIPVSKITEIANNLDTDKNKQISLAELLERLGVFK